MEDAYYPIKVRVFIFDEPITDPKLAGEGNTLLIRSMGKSPVSEVIMYNGFDINTDSYRTQFKIRYVDYPGLSIMVPDTTVSLHIKRGVNETLHANL